MPAIPTPLPTPPHIGIGRYVSFASRHFPGQLQGQIQNTLGDGTLIIMEEDGLIFYRTPDKVTLIHTNHPTR